MLTAKSKTAILFAKEKTDSVANPTSFPAICGNEEIMQGSPI